MRYRFTDYSEMCEFHKRHPDATLMAYYELQDGVIIREVWWFYLKQSNKKAA